MELRTFKDEYPNLEASRRKVALRTLFDEILNDIDSHDLLIEAILEAAIDHEADDGFGTEGLDV
jgi:hypothetical protein